MRTLRATVQSESCRSQATMLLAPARAAMAANGPVPQPMSSACTSPASDLIRATARLMAPW